MLFAEISESLLLGIVTAVLAFLGTVFSGIMGVVMFKLKQKQDATADDVGAVKTDLAETKKHINSMKDELVTAVGGRNLAEGKLAGVAQEQARSAATSPNIEEEKTVPTDAGVRATKAVGTKVDKVAGKVDQVHNLTDRLVAKTEQEALARGGAEERARADAKKEAVP